MLYRNCPINGNLNIRQKNAPPKAVSHRDLYAPKRFFSRYTAPKSHGRRQPCRDFLSCLAEKSASLECFAVLKLRFFLTNNLRGRRNTGCISRTMDSLWGKRFLQNRVNPYASPPNGVYSFVCSAARELGLLRRRREDFRGSGSAFSALRA